MKNKDAKVFLEALEELEIGKGISKDNVINSVELSLIAAYKKNFGEEKEVTIKMNKETGELNVYEEKLVVEKPKHHTEISLEEAHAIKKRAKLGDTIQVEVHCEDFRRNAIANGKQVVIQKVREAEREFVYNRFKAKENQIMTGTIRRIDERYNIHIDFEGLEAFLTVAEMSPADIYRVGERLKVFVVSVEKTNKFPKVLISRKHDGLLRKLFELEVPEISDGLIEIMAVAREAGSRAKVAVRSLDENIDTVGACIGQRGCRINNIVDELSGEKIDVVEWRESPVEFVKAVLSPAQVESVEIMDNGMTARVHVDQSQLSLAIGKMGQNARLSAKLTGMRVDIKTTEEAKS
ncbi:MAG: transcription termination factor NusA [Fusobacteriaceae bacterium]